MAITRNRWEVNVGDQVWISSGGRGSRLETVNKIGSKLVHVSDSGRGLTSYYLETGQRRDGYPGGFTTQAQRSDDSRRSAVVTTLRDTFGVEINSRATWTADALETLLDVVGEIDAKYKINNKD
jgi:anionic cell wall polymer biosynthesis LytR-Cps2A-Psr (LCP) family protein